MRRLIPLLFIVLLITACGSSAMPGGDSTGGEGGMPIGQPVEDRDLGQGGGDGYQPGVGEVPAGALIDGEREIIRTGTMSIEVDDVEATLDEIRDLAADLDGYVAGARVDGRGESGQLTLRVPAERFDAAVSALRGIGELLSLESSEDDVTTELIDLEARLENLRAAEASYRELLDRAVNVEEVLMVQSRLDEIRGQIESLDGQRAYLQRQADMATLSVMLTAPVEPITAAGEDFDPGQIVGQAAAALLSLGQAALTALIYVAIIGLPLLTIAGVVLVPLWLLRRRRRVTSEVQG